MVEGLTGAAGAGARLGAAARGSAHFFFLFFWGGSDRGGFVGLKGLLSGWNGVR